jgi:hypothetical protein
MNHIGDLVEESDKLARTLQLCQWAILDGVRILLYNDKNLCSAPDQSCNLRMR